MSSSISMSGLDERISGLEVKVKELESRLERCPGDKCPFCGALEYRVLTSEPHPTMSEAGFLKRVMDCGACGKGETVTFDSKKV